MVYNQYVNPVVAHDIRVFTGSVKERNQVMFGCTIFPTKTLEEALPHESSATRYL